MPDFIELQAQNVIRQPLSEKGRCAVEKRDASRAVYSYHCISDTLECRGKLLAACPQFAFEFVSLQRRLNA
jgi:hypothetical protein